MKIITVACIVFFMVFWRYFFLDIVIELRGMKRGDYD